MITYSHSSGLQSFHIEDAILIKRLMYAPDLFAYYDSEISRTYPGVIDMNKFNEEYLSENFINRNNRIAAIIELKNLNNNQITMLYVNKKKAVVWEDYIPISDQLDLTFNRRYVRIFENDEFYPGLIKIKVILKNE